MTQQTPEKKMVREWFTSYFSFAGKSNSEIEELLQKFESLNPGELDKEISIMEFYDKIKLSMQAYSAQQN